MGTLKKLMLFFLIPAGLFEISGCDRVSGCTDPTATNYNPKANRDNGTCTYSGSAILYFDQSYPSSVTVTVTSQTTGSVQTATASGYFQNGTPECNSSGGANFTLPVGNYNYTTSGAWSGSFSITANGCTPILLGIGTVSFFTTNSSEGNIAILIAGQTVNVSGYFNGTPDCNASGITSISLPSGNYNFSATSSLGTQTGSVTVTADNCQLVQLN